MISRAKTKLVSEYQDDYAGSLVSTIILAGNKRKTRSDASDDENYDADDDGEDGDGDSDGERAAGMLYFPSSGLIPIFFSP